MGRYDIGRGLWRRCAVAVLAAFAMVALTWAGQPVEKADTGKRLPVRSFALNGYEQDLDGQWQGMTYASDGNCYFASSSHSARHGAVFFKYDPRTGDLTRLCEDITKVCGEDPKKTPPQGKIHSPVVELDGWLYFATHLANYWPEAETAYTGAHAVGYEMATGKFRDLGIVQPNFSIYSAVGLDPVHKQLYVFTVPFAREKKAVDDCHIWRVDIATAAKTDLGKIDGAGSSHWFFVDKKGDCWFGGTRLAGTLLCARADTGKVDRYENALPDVRATATGNPPTTKGPIEWMQALDGEHGLLTMGGSGKLWEFDSTKQGDWANAFKAVAEIGANDGIALGKDRVFYISRPGNGRPDKGFDLHLYSVSLADAKVIDDGLIIDQDGRRPWRISALATDGQGKVFMDGDWHLLTMCVGNGEKVVRAPGEKGSMRHGGGDTYTEQWRGQFFSTVDVSGDLAAK